MMTADCQVRSSLKLLDRFFVCCRKCKTLNEIGFMRLLLMIVLKEYVPRNLKINVMEVLDPFTNKLGHQCDETARLFF